MKMTHPAVARRLLETHGECSRQDASEWTGPIPLPQPILEFYRDVGPQNIEVPGYGKSVFFPRLSELWEHQAGYRWNAQSGKQDNEWNENWIVVADQGADPLIHHQGQVLFAFHGTGSWTARPLFRDLNTMAASIASIGSIVERAGSQLTDERSIVHPKIRTQLIEQLSEFLAFEETQTVLGVLGWNESL